MSEERTRPNIIGPAIGVILLYFIISYGVQKFQQDLADIRGPEQSVSAESADENSESTEAVAAASGTEDTESEQTTSPAETAPTAEPAEVTSSDTEEAATEVVTAPAETDSDSDVATETEEAVPSPETDAEPAGAEASIAEADLTIPFSKGACAGCHVIPGIRGAIGVIGPDLTNIGLDAATRIEGYSAEEYLRESILEPGAFVAPECPNGACPEGVMLPSFAEALNESEVETIVSYLLTLIGGEN